jgi:hypothetical protein
VTIVKVENDGVGRGCGPAVLRADSGRPDHGFLPVIVLA